MTPVPNRLSIRYLDNFSVDETTTPNDVPIAAPESFQNESSKGVGTVQKTHQHSKEKVDQNESSNDASNETSDSENTNNHEPLTSRNLEAQNQKNKDRTINCAEGQASSSTSPPTGEDSNGKSSHSTDATSVSLDHSMKDGLPKKFFCKVCNQGFTRKHNMVSHEMIHTTIKVHRCPNCNLSFRRIHDLKRHEKLHTGEKPFHCVNCDRRFARPDALTRHLNSPHACSGTKESENSPQRTQTSNQSSSSYQASQLKDVHSVSTANAVGNSQLQMNPSSSLPSLSKTFNEEQSLPLGSESSSASLLPTAKQATLSDDSGTTSSGPDRPGITGSLAGSTMAFYHGSSSVSGDSNDVANGARPSFEINRWRSQQMHKGEQTSENIVRGILQKQTGNSNPSPRGTFADEPESAAEHDPAFSAQLPGVNNPQNSHEFQDQHLYRTYSPFHRSSASMGNTSIAKPVFPGHGMGPNAVPNLETRTNNGTVKSGHKSSSSTGNFNQGSPNSLSGVKDSVISAQPPSLYPSTHDSFPPHKQNQSQFIQGLPGIQRAPMHMNGPYQSGSGMRSFFPVVPGQEGWQNASQVPPTGNIVRPSGSTHPGWSDQNNSNSGRLEGTEQFAGPPEYVRADAYEELQNHAKNLQTRITSLEQRMEMLEEKMRRDNKNSAKLQRRQEKKAKKKSKKSSTK